MHLHSNVTVMMIKLLFNPMLISENIKFDLKPFPDKLLPHQYLISVLILCSQVCEVLDKDNYIQNMFFFNKIVFKKSVFYSRINVTST